MSQDYLKLVEAQLRVNKPLVLITQTLHKHFKQQHLQEWQQIEPEKCTNCYDFINDEEKNDNCPVCNGTGELKPKYIPLAEEELNSKVEDYIKDNYSLFRASEYPSFEEQLDILYHSGYDEWKEQITAIKNKYPKG